MHIVHVFIHIKPEYEADFRQACIANATSSIQEAGVRRFDVIQQKDDPSRFCLVEVYLAPEDQLKHRETEHYRIWRDAVADMMAEPRQAVVYEEVFPAPEKWA